MEKLSSHMGKGAMGQLACRAWQFHEQAGEAPVREDTGRVDPAFRGMDETSSQVSPNPIFHRIL